MFCNVTEIWMIIFVKQSKYHDRWSWEILVADASVYVQIRLPYKEYSDTIKKRVPWKWENKWRYVLYYVQIHLHCYIDSFHCEYNWLYNFQHLVIFQLKMIILYPVPH